MTLMSRRSTSARLVLVLGILTLLLFVALVLGVAIGATTIPPGTVLRVLAAGVFPSGWIDALPADDPQSVVIWSIRTPRVIVAMLVGAALAVAGTQVQGLFQNPMASPDVIGTSSGGAVGAVISIVLGLAQRSIVWLPLMAFAGALISLTVIYVMTTRRGRTPVAMLLLAGLGLNAMLSAATSFLISSGGVRYEIALEVVFWLMGGLDSRIWAHVWMCAPGVIIGLAVSFYFTRDLDLFLTGEDTAASLGVEVERVKRAVLVTAALLTGSAVAVSGIVGFVGLIVPHIVRFTLGPSHARVVPAAALAGASFLVGCDLLARTLMRPEEISLGAITACIGAPVFLHLLLRHRREVGYL
jgi:iron complex transport system permease protein